MGIERPRPLPDGIGKPATPPPPPPKKKLVGNTIANQLRVVADRVDALTAVQAKYDSLSAFVDWCEKELNEHRNAKEPWRRADKSVPNALCSAMDVVRWYQRSLTDTPPDRPNPPAIRVG